ncbi:MAG: DUF362 domain-containing protein [Actinobacteria bacterium]|nr:DUF362 domain-containing protein [Actinomycetota bacterium]
MISKVSILKINDSIFETVKKSIDLIGGINSYVKEGDIVLIKPNLAYPYPPPATTNPEVVESIAKLCVKAGAGQVNIGDSTSYSCKNILGYGLWSNADVIKRTKMDIAAKMSGARMIDFDMDTWKMIKIDDGIILKKAEIASSIMEADVVINVPVMKTHFETLVTLAIKNYHGIISDSYKIQFHKDDLNQKLVDIHKVVKTDLTVMDATLAMEGLGPRLGGTKKMDMIISGNDVVAIDAVATEIMGIEADRVETTRLAAAQGLGKMDLSEIKMYGLKIEDVREKFELPDVRISGIFPGITIIEGGPCIHCYGRARIFLEALKEVKNKHDISYLIVGTKPYNPDYSEVKGKVVFIGDCAIEHSTNLRNALGKRAICVDGCPPIPSVHREIDKLKGDK